MNIKKMLVIAMALSTCAAYSQDLFQATFKAKCKVVNGTGAVTTTSMSEKDLINQCIGSGTNATGSLRNSVLVYNQTANALQVVTRTNGAVSCDSFDFQTSGTPISDTKETDQLAFVFLPGQSTSIGSVIITQKNGKALSGGASDRVNITGQIQFQLSDTNGNTEICTGTFVAGKRVVVSP